MSKGKFGYKNKKEKEPNGGSMAQVTVPPSSLSAPDKSSSINGSPQPVVVSPGLQIIEDRQIAANTNYLPLCNSSKHKLEIVIVDEVFESIVLQAHQAAPCNSPTRLRRETGGILVGRCEQISGLKTIVFVEDCIQTQGLHSSLVEFQITKEDWAKALPEIRNRFENQTNITMVGVYHSHPGHGVFHSPTDQKSLGRSGGVLTQPWQFSLVIDHISQNPTGSRGLGTVGIFIDNEKIATLSPHDVLQALEVGGQTGKEVITPKDDEHILITKASLDRSVEETPVRPLHHDWLMLQPHTLERDLLLNPYELQNRIHALLNWLARFESPMARLLCQRLPAKLVAEINDWYETACRKNNFSVSEGLALYFIREVNKLMRRELLITEEMKNYLRSAVQKKNADSRLITLIKLFEIDFGVGSLEFIARNRLYLQFFCRDFYADGRVGNQLVPVFLHDYHIYENIRDNSWLKYFLLITSPLYFLLVWAHWVSFRKRGTWDESIFAPDRYWSGMDKFGAFLMYVIGMGVSIAIVYFAYIVGSNLAFNILPRINITHIQNTSNNTLVVNYDTNREIDAVEIELFRDHTGKPDVFTPSFTPSAKKVTLLEPLKDGEYSVRLIGKRNGNVIVRSEQKDIIVPIEPPRDFKVKNTPGYSNELSFDASFTWERPVDKVGNTVEIEYAATKQDKPHDGDWKSLASFDMSNCSGSQPIYLNSECNIWFRAKATVSGTSRESEFISASQYFKLSIDADGKPRLSRQEAK